MDSLIPILAIILSIGGPLAVAVVVILASHRKDMAIRDLVANAAAAGRSPAEIREIVATLQPKTAGSRPRSLRVGILLVFTAVGMAAATLFSNNQHLLLPASFCLFIGIAFIVIWRLIDRNGKAS